MKSPTLLAGVAAMLVASSGFEAFGAAAGHPYAAIVERNAFGLRPVPPPQAPVQPEAPPVPTRDIKLTGISTLLGEPQVFIEIIDPQTKKTERPPGLEVGEQQFEVEILSINPEEGVVRIRNRGDEQTLDFVNNGIKPGVPTPAAAAARGRVPVPALSRSTTVRTPVPPPPTGVPSVAAIPASANSRAVVSGGPGGATTVTAPRPGISPEAEARIEAYRKILEARQRAGGPSVPAIVPPTRLVR